MVEPVTTATVVLSAAKMAINLGQRIKGVNDAKKAVERAKDQARRLNSLMLLRSMARYDSARQLVSSQLAAVGSQGLASSTGQISASNRAMFTLLQEARADELETQGRIESMLAEARGEVVTARQRAVFGTIGDAVEETPGMTQIFTQRRRANLADSALGKAVAQAEELDQKQAEKVADGT